MNIWGVLDFSMAGWNSCFIDELVRWWVGQQEEYEFLHFQKILNTLLLGKNFSSNRCASRVGNLLLYSNACSGGCGALFDDNIHRFLIFIGASPFLLWTVKCLA